MALFTSKYMPAGFLFFRQLSTLVKIRATTLARRGRLSIDYGHKAIKSFG